jgi:5'-nucleotidase
MVRRRIRTPVYFHQTILALLLAVSACNAPEEKADSGPITISIIGTNDVHGSLSARPGRGGLATFSGYVTALRIARAADGGEVLLIDGGDMWQGTLESNLSEGASVMEAYNALDYAAATIGNHEFDFGPVGSAATPQSDTDDARGALKQRALQAHFPLLAANLIDTSTNLPVDWPNVQPSTLLEVAGIKVGVIGVMTENALITTLAANIQGLRVAPLAETIANEASALREKGAALIIVAAHAGSRCQEFNDPLDLSSCDLGGEIMRVASALPPGLVDHIVAGHSHQKIAHTVNGVSITSNTGNASSFGRVDFFLDRDTLAAAGRKVYPPQQICAFVDTSNDRCAVEDDESEKVVAARYENEPIFANREISAIAKKAADRVEEKKAERIGPYLETAITLNNQPESALGHLMTDALLQSMDADVAIHNVAGGIRANLPAGELTYGSVFTIFPFDNRVVVLEMSGADLRRVIAHQVERGRRLAGLSGMRVFVYCSDDNMDISMRRADGRDIADNDTIRVVVNDFLVLGGDDILTVITPEGGIPYSSELPMVRDVLVKWFGEQENDLRADQFLGEDNRRWHLPNPMPPACAFAAN